MMQREYDVVVVGAGPAGSTAARYAARSGASVLLLEKDRQVGVPVRCAEGVGEAGLLASVDAVDPKWVSREINGVTFVPPNGNSVELATQRGYILERKIFDASLAEMAVNVGAELITKAYVYDLILENNQVRGVRCNILDEKFDIRAKIVIGADGVETRVGRWAGIKTHCKMQDIESCAQVTATGIDVNPEHIHLYFSKKWAPHGYLWVFPKGGGVANVGLGIAGSESKTHKPIDYLQNFLRDEFPNASILTTVFGGVCCDKTLDTLVKDGFMLAGDAAHQVNPISGGGINPGMYAGRLAGEAAAAAVQDNDVSAYRLHEYEKRWHKKEGRNHKICYKIKDYVFDFTDEQFNSISDRALDVPFEKRTLMGIFRIALQKKPALILDAFKVFS